MHIQFLKSILLNMSKIKNKINKIVNSVFNFKRLNKNIELLNNFWIVYNLCIPIQNNTMINFNAFLSLITFE